MSNKANELRASIKKALEETDYYGLSDRTMTTEMRDYRQALRDIPQQEGFPDNVTWPPVIVIPAPE